MDRNRSMWLGFEDLEHDGGRGLTRGDLVRREFGISGLIKAVGFPIQVSGDIPKGPLVPVKTEPTLEMVGLNGRGVSLNVGDGDCI